LWIEQVSTCQTRDQFNVDESTIGKHVGRRRRCVLAVHDLVTNGVSPMMFSTKSSSRRPIMVAVSLIVVCFVLCCMTTVTVRIFTCGHCRMHQVRYSVANAVLRRVSSDTPCSIWFSTHKPPHEHLWVAAPFAQDKSVTGTVLRSITFEHGQAFWSLSSRQHQIILEVIEQTQDRGLQELLDEVLRYTVAGNEDAARDAILQLQMKPSVRNRLLESEVE